MTIFTNFASNTKIVEKPEVVHPEKPSISFKIIVQLILLLAIAFDALIIVRIWGGSDIRNYSSIAQDIAYFIGITLNSPHILALHFAHKLYNFFWYAINFAYPMYLEELSSAYFLAFIGTVYVAYLYMVFKLANHERRRWAIKEENKKTTTENENLNDISIRY